MAQFEIANKITLKCEGYFVNDPKDPGGETYRGISKRNFPKWSGWTIIDKKLPLKTNQMIVNPILDQLIDSFYKTNFWDKLIGDHIDSQRIANLLYDWYVNAGSPAIKNLLRLIGGEANHISIDMLNKINAADENKLFSEYKQARIDFYVDLVKRKPPLNKFLSGWLTRTEQFK